MGQLGLTTLAERLAPTSLEEVVGHEYAKKAIRSWVEKDTFPRCQLYIGPVGTGKSTLAGIVAKLCQGPGGWEGSDIRQINAGTVGKVDDMRALVEESSSRPFIGRYRVFILEEAQRVTDAADDALLVPMEKNLHTIWILTSSEPDKIPAAIRSRCSAATFELKPLSDADRAKLVVKALAGNVSAEEGSRVLKFLYDAQVDAPREILGVLDQYLSGVPLEEAIHGSEHEPLYPEVAKAVLSGNWTKTAGLLKQIKTADYRAMVAVVSAKLRWALLDSEPGPRADEIAVCLVGIGNASFADGTAYASLCGLLYKTAKVMGR